MKNNIHISIRELIQNALDEEELVGGRPYVQFEQDMQGTWRIQYFLLTKRGDYGTG